MKKSINLKVRGQILLLSLIIIAVIVSMKTASDIQQENARILSEIEAANLLNHGDSEAGKIYLTDLEKEDVKSWFPVNN